MMLRLLLFSLIAFGLHACSGNQRKLNLLEGEWQGTLLLEEGDSVAIDPAELGFSFQQDGKVYTYRSTLNYKEAGSYYIQTRYLFTRDTLPSVSKEKGVEILKLSADSLHLKMMEQGKERIMKLVKKQG
jgi:hypothetical protein